MSMNLSMLGNDYRYAFEPVGGDSYVKANGCGYINGTYGLGDSLQDAADDWIGTYGNMDLTTGKVRNKPIGAADPSVTAKASTYGVNPVELYNRINSTISLIVSQSRGSKVAVTLTTANEVIAALTKGVISVADAYKAAKGLSAKDQQTIDTYLGFEGMILANLPWIIGGGAVLVGVFIVMGTRKSRRYA